MEKKRRGVKERGRSEMRNVRKDLMKRKQQSRQQLVLAKRRRFGESEKEEKVMFHSAAELASFQQQLVSTETSEEEQSRMLICLRRFLSAPSDKHIDMVVESGLTNSLLQILVTSSTTQQLDVLWCLSNIAAGSYEQTKQVTPAIPILMELIQSSNFRLAEHATWAVGNIAADCEEFRQHLISSGAIPALTNLLSHEDMNPNLVQTVLWTLSNLARGSSSSARPFLECGLMAQLLKCTSKDQPMEEIGIEMAWLLSFLTAKEEDCLEIMLQQQLLNLIIPYFESVNDELIIPLLRTLGNICCCKQSVEMLIENPTVSKLVLSQVKKFLKSTTQKHPSTVVKESLWVLSSLLSTGEKELINLITADGSGESTFLSLAIHHFLNGTFEVKKEASFAVYHFLLSSKMGELWMVQDSILEGFLNLLSASDLSVVNNALHFLEVLLEEDDNLKNAKKIEDLNGIELLENLEYAENELSGYAAHLVNKYYGENYGVQLENDVNCCEQTNSTVFNFSNPGNPGQGRGKHLVKPAWAN